MIYIESSKAGRVTKGEAYLKRPSWKNPIFFSSLASLIKEEKSKMCVILKEKCFHSKLVGRKTTKKGREKKLSNLEVRSSCKSQSATFLA